MGILLRHPADGPPGAVVTCDGCGTRILLPSDGVVLSPDPERIPAPGYGPVLVAHNTHHCPQAALLVNGYPGRRADELPLIAYLGLLNRKLALALRGMAALEEPLGIV